MGRLLSLIVFLSVLTACPPGTAEDHFQLELGNTWEYFLVDGGEEGEFWRLDMLDADDNSESGRGDLFFHMVRTVPNALGEGIPADYEQRRFNLALEQDLTGSVPKPIGWTYRWLPDAQKEGDRGEYFVVSPGSAADWSDDWSYDFGEDTGSDFSISVTTERSDVPRQTSFGTFTDLVLIERTVEITSFSSGEELVQVTVTSETWASGVGLIHFHILAADGTTTEAVLRTTNVTTSPGT
jgi:hypothetical protein